MVRVTLQHFNSTNKDTKLDFSNAGTLTQPIREAKTISILRFNIPNSAMPIMLWSNPISNPPIDGDNLYSFTLSYMGISFTQYVKYINLNTIDPIYWKGCKLIYEMSHLVSMINKALKDAVDGLNALISLPSLVYPRVIFENNYFSFIVLSSAYDSSLTNPIKIYMNDPLRYMFQSLPVTWDPTLLYGLIFDVTPESTYLTNYIKITQNSMSLGNFLSMRTLLITTSMPIVSEIYSSSNANSNQTGINILQSFDMNYNNGITDILTNNEFYSPSEPFRRVDINCKNLYDIRCQVSIITNTGNILPFALPSLGYATITLEFL